MDEIGIALFNVAGGIAQDHIGLCAPEELVVAVADTIGVNSTDAAVIAALIVRSMRAQRAFDLRLTEMGLEP